jgi:hypothetical protein
MRPLSDTSVTSRRNTLKTPRAAAIAGIIFAVLYGTTLVLLYLSVTPVRKADITWLETNAGMASLALNLMPYAGIAFLWFIGVIRDHLGDMEDRLFATVFLGSGLLFLALTFVGAALVGGMMDSYMIDPGILDQSGLYTYNRAVTYQAINIYAIRMAGVFMISLATIWIRTGLMRRTWAILTYALALVLLLSIGFSLLVTLIFPAWVLVVSVVILIRNLHDPPPEWDAAGA